MPDSSPHNKCTEHKAIVKAQESLCKHMAERFLMMEKAIDTAKKELDRRLEAMNEFREQLTRQANQFISKTEVDLLLSKMEVKLENLQNISSQRIGSSKWSDHIITVLIGMAVILIMSLIVWIITKR